MASVKVLDRFTSNRFRVRQTQVVCKLAVLRVLAKVGGSSSARASKNLFPFSNIRFPIPNLVCLRRGNLADSCPAIAAYSLAMWIGLEIELRHDSTGARIPFELMESALYVCDTTHRIVPEFGSNIPNVRICPDYLGYESCLHRAAADLSLDVHH